MHRPFVNGDNLRGTPLLPLSAYAVFDGGGVKGAALEGSLRAATQRGITFVGFGGTSAGSVVALLAAIGTPVDEIQDLVLETEFYPGSR